MRCYVQLAVWTTLLSATLAEAQGTPPPLFTLAGGSIQDLTAINTMQLLSGSLPFNRQAGNFTNSGPPSLPPAKDALQRVGYVQPAQMTANSCPPSCPAPNLDTGPCCPPVEPCAPEPPPPQPKRTHEVRPPYVPSVNYGGCFPDCCDFLHRLAARCDGTVLPELIYRNWLLNLLWRVNCDAPQELPYHVWVQSEYLQWRVKSAPIAAPLVTGNNDPTAIGALGEPGTTILFGAGSNQSTSFNNLSGGRFTVGSWLCPDCPFAVEASGFFLGQGSRTFLASSAGGTAPIVSVPFFATQPFNFINPAGETALNAGGAANQVIVNLTTQLWGAEANVLMDPWGDYANLRNDFNSPLRMLTIVGVRYLDLLETLSSSDTFFDPLTSGTVLVADRFGTRNQFFGGQIGARANLCLGRWALEGTAKLALGDNHQSLNIGGATTVANAAFGLASGTTAGGVFGEPSNSGVFRRDVFAFVPEGQLKLFYVLTQNVRPFIGYNFIYLNQAIRPGSQLDRNINPTQNVFFSVPPGAIVGPLSPLPYFRSTDFWAQGFNIGVECRF